MRALDYKDRVRQREKRAKLTALIRQSKSVPCTDCGVSYPFYVMDLDHRPGAVKHFTMSEASYWNKPLEKVAAEIAKCDAVCANCHRSRTYLRKQACATE